MPLFVDEDWISTPSCVEIEVFDQIQRYRSWCRDVPDLFVSQIS